MTGSDVMTTLQLSGLPVYFLYPPASIEETIPCITYTLDRRGIDGEPNCKTTITATLWCSIDVFATLAAKIDAMIAEKIRCLDRANVRRLDLYEATLNLAKCTWTIPVQA